VTQGTHEPPPASGIDTTVPHSARIWNYWLGGKDNYEVDRAAGDAWAANDPGVRVLARATRAFLKRAVLCLAGEVGIRQFLDVGTGLPTAQNTHEVAQAVAPDARVVYAGNDPLVLAHARALLTSTAQGATRYLDADMNDAVTLVERAGEILDFDRPVAVFFIGVLGHVPDLAAAQDVVGRLMQRVPSGSYLALCNGTLPRDPHLRRGVEQAQQEYIDSGAVPYLVRPEEQVAEFFAGLELVEPGFVSVPEWRPELVLPGEQELPRIASAVPGEPVNMFGGVARKP
jgi:hypothetical protein